MIRVLVFFAVVAALAFGAVWLADHPGHVLISWGGRDVEFSTLLAIVGIVVAAVLLVIGWSLLRFLFRLPAVMATSGVARKRSRGLKALSRGMVAVGAGDAGAAQRYAYEAGRLLKHEPLAMLLQAQAAQLAGDRPGAQRVFGAMLDHDETRILGLRGLHMEASRAGDQEAAFRYAAEAQTLAALPWAGSAVLQHHAGNNDWADAIATVDRNAAGQLIDRPTANRQRAVLQTALAMDQEERAPEEALRLVREALRVAPTLVPAAALAGRLLARRGDLKKASRVLETAYAVTPHPALGTAYLAVRQGDSAADRLARAETLARQAPGHPESRLLVAGAALGSRDLNRARTVMAPLLNGEEGQRPTARACLMMADIEEVENGISGALFEWLQRAARAPHDPAWIADGVISDTWAPTSPVTGRIDAFVWEAPNEQLRAPVEAPRALAGAPVALRQDASAQVALPRADVSGTGENSALSPEQTDRPEVAAAVAGSDASPSALPATRRPGVAFTGAPDDPGLAARSVPADRL